MIKENPLTAVTEGESLPEFTRVYRVLNRKGPTA